MGVDVSDSVMMVVHGKVVDGSAPIKKYIF